jgi:hypothetical protein
VVPSWLAPGPWGLEGEAVEQADAADEGRLEAGGSIIVGRFGAGGHRERGQGRAPLAADPQCWTDLEEEEEPDGMELSQAIQKAVLLLDLQGQVGEAEQVLRDSLAQHPEFTVERVRAQIFLGELLLRLGRQEGRVELQQALSRPCPADWDDVLAEELSRAKRLLGIG